MTDQNNGMPPVLPEPAAPTAAPAGAPAEATFTPSTVEEPQGNVVLGVLAGLCLGIVAAGIYAVVARFLDREIGWLAVLIGFAVAFGMALVGKRQNPVLGVVAAVIAAALFIVAIFASMTLVIANEYGAPIADVLDVLLESPVDLIKAYFEDDIMSYLFLGLAVVPAFLQASGLRNRSAD